MPLVSWASAQVWHSARTVQRADGLGRVDLPGGGAGGDRREEQVGVGCAAAGCSAAPVHGGLRLCGSVGADGAGRAGRRGPRVGSAGTGSPGVPEAGAGSPEATAPRPKRSAGPAPADGFSGTVAAPNPTPHSAPPPRPTWSQRPRPCGRGGVRTRSPSFPVVPPLRTTAYARVDVYFEQPGLVHARSAGWASRRGGVASPAGPVGPPGRARARAGARTWASATCGRPRWAPTRRGPPSGIYSPAGPTRRLCSPAKPHPGS